MCTAVVFGFLNGFCDNANMVAAIVADHPQNNPDGSIILGDQ
jgi:hypothetical protein